MGIGTRLASRGLGFCLGIVAGLHFASMAVSAGADQACCEINSDDRTCFDDIIGSGQGCPAGNGLGPGTTCAADCNCTDTCDTCVGKQAGNLSSVEIQLLGPPVYNGTNTTYRYRVCQIAGHDLSHWSLGLPDACCSRIVSASGGRTTGTCGPDPNTGLFGLKFETSQGVDSCEGDCGLAGTVFTITLSGNATTTGCVKAANKANGDENTSTACIVGPSESCSGSCINDSHCNDGIPCTIDDCDPQNPAADSNGCVHLPDHGLCNDSNPCTDEQCIPGLGCQPTPDDTNTCGNGLYCDGPERCVAGSCQPGAPPCDDGVPCTTNQCNEATDSCSYVPNSSSCTDGLHCNGSEICHPTSGCQPGTAVDCTHLNTECAVGVCDEAADSCTTQPVNNGGLCDDGLYCTQPDQCAGGECIGTVRNCADQIGCTNDSCDEDLDRCLNLENDEKCDNGLFCDGSEICAPGDSAANPVTGCVPGDYPCAACPCDEIDGGRCVCDCPGSPCPDAPDCFRSECLGGTCVFEPLPLGQSCIDDGLACTTEACDGEGECIHTPVDGLCAADQNPCTDTICHPTFGCVHVPDDTNGCDDGLFCTIEDHCVDGECTGLPSDCNDNVECTSDTCDESADRCVNTPDDGLCPASSSPCLSYQCQPPAGCVVVFHDGTACDDGLACTEGDLCVAGACAGQPVVCNDGLTCTADSCDTATGECLYTPQHALCNDQNPCTDDLCVPGVGCVYTPDNTNVCADELFCNGVELCIKGTCKGGQLPCGDSIDCTADSCNEAKDVCVHVPDDSLCQDALVCNGIEYCDRTKGCKPRPPVVCNDGVACTIDVCVEPGGTCTYTPGDTSCQDDLFCNGEEVCHPTHGCLPGTPVDCDDGALCSTDECNESTDVCDNHCDVPDLTCTDQVFECDNVGEFLPPVIDDDCSENPVATCTEIITPGKLPQERKITRSCSFTNDCSSTGTCQQVINVQDTTPPEIICPPDRSFECDGIGDSGQPIVSDNCDPDPQVTVEVETIEGDCTPNVAGIGVPPKLIKINTFTATDGGATMTATGDATGNVSICEQRIEIVDTHGPLFVDCPASVSGCVDQPLVFVPPSCTDTCGSCLVTCTRSDGLPLAAPVTPGLTISCTSRDECNNASAPCTVSVDTINCDEIPALSLWGLAILALLLMIAAKLRFSRNTLLNT